MLRRRPFTLLFAALALAAVAGLGGCKRQKEPLRVAAASDLHFAFDEIGKAFEKKTGEAVTFSFGSTGLLAKQIAEGAPFDLFAAANVSFVDDVVKAGACDPGTKAVYARGRIVLYTPKNAAARPHDVADLVDPRFAKIAIANPEHAPYGKAAKQALAKAGVWEKVQPRVVYGENIQQTLEFAQSGNADVSIVALSLATVTPGDYEPVDPALHDPIDQAMVACSRGKNPGAAKEFAEFVGSPDGRAIMRRYGFFLPGETMVGVKMP